MTTIYDFMKMFFFSGVIGFINYNLLQQVSLLEYSTKFKDDKNYLIALFSLIDYILFLCLFNIKFVDDLIMNEIVKLLLVIVISIFLTFTLYSWLIMQINYITNLIRIRRDQSPLNLNSVRKIVFNKKAPYLVYIYSLETNKLISCGYMDKYNTPLEDDFEMSIFPISRLKANYNRIHEIAVKERNKIEKPKIYINFDKKIKIIVFYNE